MSNLWYVTYTALGQQMRVGPYSLADALANKQDIEGYEGVIDCKLEVSHVDEKQDAVTST